MSKKELKLRGFFVYEFSNGDYKFQRPDGIEILVRDDKEIAKGKFIFSYDNGDYKYRDDNRKVHLIRDGKELLVCDKIYKIKDGIYNCVINTNNFN